MTCFVLFCIPCVRKMSGFTNPHLTKIRTTLIHKHKMDPERPEYVRGTIKWKDGKFLAESTGNQISSRLLSFRSANALLLVPQKEGFIEAGEELDALIIDSI